MLDIHFGPLLFLKVSVNILENSERLSLQKLSFGAFTDHLLVELLPQESDQCLTLLDQHVARTVATLKEFVDCLGRVES